MIEAGADTSAAGQDGANALSKAAMKLLPAIVELILARGHGADDGGPAGMTPLMWAANRGDVEIIDLMLAAGANINARSRDPGSNGGCTALMFVGASRLDAARHLLARGADARIKNNRGETAAQSAARNTHQAGFEALVALLEAAERG